MLPEGLDQQPVSRIARHISLMGFNCVRLTWATYMFTRHSNLTVAQSLINNGLHDAMSGIGKKNPQLLGLTVVEAHRAVIEELDRHGVMSVLDNQRFRSPPQTCLPNLIVIGISLRNELRGPFTNQSVWYENVQKGAKTIHRANPNLLIIISGLDYDIDFFLPKGKALELKHEK
ncbi:hypothetical protein K7X08_029448 [Anisodus acutangulus]|uniref:Uncharacterized protein n=1 Tax=Anisodus acutangulus TaxID=402998 RepID=A0A9Q1QUS0_9SOLA|nr:hypothetical protein K7X08_029448 [Anisodus acutangulus]